MAQEEGNTVMMNKVVERSPVDELKLTRESSAVLCATFPSSRVMSILYR